MALQRDGTIEGWFSRGLILGSSSVEGPVRVRVFPRRDTPIVLSVGNLFHRSDFVAFVLQSDPLCRHSRTTKGAVLALFSTYMWRYPVETHASRCRMATNLFRFLLRFGSLWPRPVYYLLNALLPDLVLKLRVFQLLVQGHESKFGHGTDAASQSRFWFLLFFCWHASAHM